jgi:hypothetical protein
VAIVVELTIKLGRSYDLKQVLDDRCQVLGKNAAGLADCLTDRIRISRRFASHPGT